MSFLSVKQLSKQFHHQSSVQQVLNNVNFNESLKRCVLINGRSGSGKTTLLNVIAGLSPIDSGSITIQEQDITQLSLNDRSAHRLKTMGMVYQSFNFLPALSVYENCVIPALMLGTSKVEMDARVQDLAKSFRITHILNKLPASISGGELQRAAIIRALINKPKLVLADEPSGNLDTENRDIIFETFQQIVHSEDLLILMTSHDPVAKSVVDGIYELSDGCLSNG